jgi:hypothetical protein
VRALSELRVSQTNAFWDLQALLDILNQPRSLVPTTLTDSDGHTVPNIWWSIKLAQIAADKYVAGAEPTSASPSSTARIRTCTPSSGRWCR